MTINRKDFAPFDLSSNLRVTAILAWRKRLDPGLALKFNTTSVEKPKRFSSRCLSGRAGIFIMR